jgi:hypothetical protein
MSELRIWQTLAAGLFLLWVWSFAWWSFRAELTAGQWLHMFRDDVIKSVQQLNQQQQDLGRRLQAVEAKAAEK